MLAKPTLQLQILNEEKLCGGCGLILVQNMLDTSYENNGYTQEDFMRLTRTGPGISLTMHDKGLSTVIGANKDSSGNALPTKQNMNSTDLRTWDQRSKSRKTATLSKAFT